MKRTNLNTLHELWLANDDCGVINSKGQQATLTYYGAGPEVLFAGETEAQDIFDSRDWRLA